MSKEKNIEQRFKRGGWTKKIAAFSILLCLIVSMPATASAQPSKSSHSVGDLCIPSKKLPIALTCVDGVIQDCAEPQGRTAYIACSAQTLSQQQKKMSVVTKKMLAKFSSKQGSAHLADTFSASQVAWKKYIELNCKYVEAIREDGGNAAPAIAMDCLVQSYKERINVIQKEMQEISER
jgi:uncharacterized protein YecT (DUF1311 family)